MGRKTTADKAQNSTAYYEDLIQKAYATGELQAPMEEAVRWFRASVKQKAEEEPAEAQELYKNATSQLSAYAKQLQHQIIKKSKQK